MAAPLDPANIDLAIDLYLAGKPSKEIQAATGVGATVLHRYRKARGIPLLQRSHLDPDTVVAAYLSGASEYAIARENGVSRGPIARILNERGIERRGWSEAGLTRNARMTGEQRSAQTRNANKVARQRRIPEIDKHRRAIRAELTGAPQSQGERALAQYLSERGYAPTHQRARGRCNVDLAGLPVASG